MEENKVEEGEIVDERTKEIIPRGAPPTTGIVTTIDISKVGILQVEEKALEVLQEKLNPEDVQIREDGLVYLPWTWYNKRLNRAFGILQWALAPMWFPVVKESGKFSVVVWMNALVVKGVFVSAAAGETSYIQSNAKMTYGDALEGARSNSLARNCKNIGMALELWDREWVSNWIKNYAEKVENDRGDKVWRKKGFKKSAEQPKQPVPAPESAQGSPQPENTTNPEPETQKTAAEGSAKTYTGNQIFADTDLVKQLAADTEKPVVTVCKVLNTLEKGKKFTLAEIHEMIVKGAQ